MLAADPAFGVHLKTSYDVVRMTISAYTYRGAIGMDIPTARFVWFETCYLPLGDAQDAVDHILHCGRVRAAGRVEKTARPTDSA